MLLKTQLAIVLVAIMMPKTRSDSYDSTLYLPGLSTAHYVLLRPDFSRVQEEISVCSWVKKLKDHGPHDFWFSYATSTSSAEFEISVSSSSIVYTHLLGHSYSANDGAVNKLNTWQHCCVTWSYAHNTLKRYVNGLLVKSDTPSTSRNRKIGTGGTLVLGQYQSSPGSFYPATYSFAGELYQLNVFDRPLSAGEVGAMYQKGRCSYLNRHLSDSVVLSWKDMLEADRHGLVAVRTSECTFGWNVLDTFLGKTVTTNLIEHLKENHRSNSQCHAIHKSLHFPEKFNMGNYVLLKPDFSKVQDEISVCSWVKKIKDNSAKSVWFSYATPSSDNEILLYDYLNPTLLFSGNRAASGINNTLNEWQHCCWTWSSEKETLRVYINGILKDSITTSTSGRKIGKNGTLVLGQDQDIEGGGFDISNSFAGDIYQLNIFKRPLKDEEIGTMFQNGLHSYLDHFLLEDLVLSWEEVLEGERHGMVSVVAAGCNQWDNLFDFRGWEITEELIEHLKKDSQLQWSSYNRRRGPEMD